MKNKKTVIISIIVIVLLSISGILYFVLTKEDKDTTLSIIDKRWIESNKNKVFDISIVNNIPIFNYKGNGVFFDFINEIEESTKLDFNPISYNYRVEPTSSYAFKITKELNDSDLLIYEDNYVLVGTSREKYNNLSEINNVKIGVFEDEMDLVSRYVNTSVSIQKYKSIEELLASINVEDEASNDSSKKEDSFNDLIAIPKTVYLDKIIGNEELNIVYNITDLKEYYVLSLGDDDRLNTIIKKYFNKWYSI